MKRNIGTIFTLLFIVLLSWLTPIMAQSEEQIEEFNRQREEFFTEKLKLTPEESELFWPMYNDYFNRKMKLSEDERSTFRFCYKNAENLTEAEFVKYLEKIKKLKDDQHALQQEYYHEKFISVLPPRKVMLLYKVEWDFRHHLLRQIRRHGPDHKEHRKEGARSGDLFD